MSEMRVCERLELDGAQPHPFCVRAVHLCVYITRSTHLSFRKRREYKHENFDYYWCRCRCHLVKHILLFFFSSVHQLKHAREKSDAPQRESERVSVSGTVLIYALICSFIFHFAHCATVSVVLNAQIPSDPMDVCWRMYICVLLIAENASLLPPIFRIRANLRFGCKSFLRFLFLRFVLWLSSLPIFCTISNWKISLRAISHSKRVYTKRNCPSP